MKDRSYENVLVAGGGKAKEVGKVFLREDSLGWPLKCGYEGLDRWLLCMGIYSRQQWQYVQTPWVEQDTTQSRGRQRPCRLQRSEQELTGKCEQSGPQVLDYLPTLKLVIRIFT